MDEEKDLFFVLDSLEIRHLYPEKLTPRDLNVIWKLYTHGSGFPTPESPKEFVEIFHHGLKLCHPFTRNLQVPRASLLPYSTRSRRSNTSQVKPNEKENVEIHPLDLQVAIFLCCDPIAKQDFMSLMWKCKFGFPFVVQLDQLEPLCAYIKSLNSILYTRETDGSFSESRLPDVPLNYICFLRYGEISKSKSKILNKVMGQSEKEHSVFFHRDSTASTKIRAVCSNGLIECMCAPIPIIGDCMFLNLRGDVKKLPVQLTLMAKIACTFVVVCTLEKMEKSKAVLEKMTSHQKNIYIVYLITDLAEDDKGEKEDRVFRFARDVSSFETDVKAKVNLEIIPMHDSPENEVTGEVLRFLSKTKPTISTLTTIEKDLERISAVDRTRYNESDRKVSQLMETVSCTRSECFPLSGKPFEKWSKANKEIHKLKNRPPEIDIETYRSLMENKKIKHRNKQIEMLKSKHLFSEKFIELFHETEENKREVLLRNLSQRLEDGNRKEAGLAQKNITDIILTSKETFIDSYKDSKNSYHQLVEEMDRYLLTMSDLIFEIGQHYEAHQDTAYLSNLPAIAVEMLLNRYPFPLMDRNSSTVPIVWVNAVLKQLHQTLREKENSDVKIMVVSILGIQSTGKSSLLNTMFGAGFTVGSGRCTRGIYMHVVRLDGNKHVKYICVIDTEGLCAIEDYADPTKERELATFVLGLADVTILNIMGENTHYLRDVLPISVHAFLRMNLIGMHPKCIVVHQNVDKMKKHILEKQWDQLEVTLDKYTHTACEIEKVPSKRFRDIVELNISKDIYPFSSYKTTHGSIDPISEGYSKSCMELLRDVIHVANHAERQTTLNEFREYMTLLWTAVDKENFVYYFKNTAEAGANSKLSHKTCILSWMLRHDARTKLFELETLIQNSSAEESCREKRMEVKEKFKTYMDIQYDEHRQTFKLFFKEPHQIYCPFLQKWKKDSLKKFETFYNETVTEKIKEIDAIAEHQLRKVRLGSLKSCVDLKRFTLNKLHEDEDANAEDIYSCWVQTSTECEEFDFKQEIDLQASICFYEAFPSHRNFVEERLRQPCQFQDINDFQLLKRYFTTCDETALVEIQKQKAKHEIDILANNLKDKFLQRKQERRRFDKDVFIQSLLLKTERKLNEEFPLTNIEFELDLTQSILEYTKAYLIHIEQDIISEEKAQREIAAKEQLKLVQDIVRQKREKTEEDIHSVIKNLTQSMLEMISIKSILSLETKLRKYKKRGMEVVSSKKLFLLYIVYKLLKENKPSLFKVYCVNPLGIMRGCLCDLFDQMCRKEESEIQGVITSCADVLFVRITQIIEQTEYQAGEHKTWLEHLFNNLESVISLSSIPENQQIKREKLLKGMREVEQHLRKEALDSFNERNFDSVRDQVVNETLKCLSGCTERCPKCREICMNENSDHDGKHQVLMHKPLILNENCSQLMTCSQFYTDSSPDMEGWEVKPSLVSSDSFWQLCTVLYSGIDLSTLPDTWKEQWTRDTEIQKLLALMHDTCERW